MIWLEVILRNDNKIEKPIIGANIIENSVARIGNPAAYIVPAKNKIRGVLNK